jgi:plasmid stabilization system protein ParE
VTVLFAPEAAEDLESAIGYVSEQNAAAASKMADRIFRAVEHLAAGLFKGREVELASGARVRFWYVHPMRIYYRRTAQVLQVVRIYHHARSPIER